MTDISHKQEEGERVHCVVKMRIAADFGHHYRTDVELEQDAGDLILFTLQPGPHRKISHSEIWKVDENRISELGEGSALALVGDCALYFYSNHN